MNALARRVLVLACMTPDGLIAISSKLLVEHAADRLEAVARGRGMTVFARVDHAANASSAGLTLRPTTLLIFGDARVGTALMQAAQTMGIDLPLRVLVWRDEHDQTWLAYSDPAWLAQRHGAVVDGRITAITSGLATIIQEAARETST